ncbi:hypothetical protein [Anaerosporobacter sp.]|uniref:hypothetical protein n=1 Tax=Anaerosporobacter sp. TaxID=1872529 RepID=UPI00286F4DA9|nr:hypothetical protein [Anaerosporobacter sp.]
MKVKKCVKVAVGIIAVSVISILVVCNFYHKAKLSEERKKNFVRCSLQERRIAKGNGITITTLDGGYVFEDSLEETYINGKPYWSYLGLKGGGSLDAVFRYEDRLIYIAPYIRMEDEIMYQVAIIQDIETGEYNIVKLVDEKNWCRSTGKIVWIIGDELYYDFYYVPEGKDFWRYSIHAMDLKTYKKKSVCNYDELGVLCEEAEHYGAGEEPEPYSGGRIDYFVVREDGAIAFEEVCNRRGFNIYVCRDGVIKQRVDSEDVYLQDYDMKGLYYIRKENTADLSEDDEGWDDRQNELVLQTDKGKETVLLREEDIVLKDERLRDFVYLKEVKVSDEYFLLIESDIVQKYDFNGQLLKEAKIKYWEGEDKVSSRQEVYYEGSIGEVNMVWYKDSMCIQVTSLE